MFTYVFIYASTCIYVRLIYTRNILVVMYIQKYIYMFTYMFIDASTCIYVRLIYTRHMPENIYIIYVYVHVYTYVLYTWNASQPVIAE